VSKRNKCSLIAVLFVSIATFLSFSIYISEYSSNSNVLSSNLEVPVPGKMALGIREHVDNIKESVKSDPSDTIAPFLAARDIFNIIEITQEQVAQLKEYIIIQNPRIPETTALEEAYAFLHYSMKYNVPLDLVVAVANTESHFDPGAKSGHGSAGIMQVTWKVHSALLQANGIKSEEELHDPRKGIAAGCLLISRYLKEYGNTREALGRYYGGSASVYWGRVSKNLARLRQFTR
jgi:soluble lytic murein transglycosylase-like protein